MANLPEKNITTVDKITSIPSNTNLYINANGEFRQATVDDVLKASPVIADSITNQYKNASGSPILLTDSAKGVAIDFNAKGRSTQTQYSGKNKLDCSGLSVTTSNGVTFTPYYDDNGCLLYVNVNGTATATASFVLNSNMLFDVESYILNGCPSGGSSSTYKLDVLNTKGSILVVDSGNGVSFDVASAFASQGVRIVVYGGVTANNLKFYPMIRLASVTDSTYEPYTNGASPNPTYPQAIKSVGDMGYFDGELLQGNYSTSTGVLGSNTQGVASKNETPCNVGDEITLTYDDVVAQLSLVFYSDDGFIELKSATNTNTLTVAAPNGATKFHFDVRVGLPVTPQTAKHICVTINDKYSLIVDSEGKNEILTKEVGTYSYNGGTYNIDEDRKVTVSGGISANTFFPIGTARLIGGKTYRLTGTPNGITIPLYLHIQGAVIDKGNGISFTPSTTREYIIGIYVNSSVAVTATNILFEPMLRLAEITDDTYEPYIHSRKYIPISAPLRGIGEVTDVASLSECEVDRKFIKVVFDGSDDESWLLNVNTGFTSVFYSELLNFRANNLDRNKVICDHYIVKEMVTPMDYDYIISIGTYINVRDIRFTTVDEFKAWLQSNPITVIYELAEPTTESIEPIDVDTFEGVTHISVSDDAEMEIEYPTSKVAGIASIGWSKGRRAEYDLEQLKAQMLALQTTIVSTV